MPELDQLNFENLDDVFRWLLTSGFRITIIILVSIVGYWLLRIGTRYLTRRIQKLDDVEGSELDKRVATIFRLVNTTGVAIILISATLMILDLLAIDITPLLASVGFAGLAIGLGAQTLVKDIVGGVFILVENQYQVGDVIEVGGKKGTVETMSLRATQIRDSVGTLHIVPNGDIRVVSNHSRDWSRATVDVLIADGADVNLALATLEAVAESLAADEEIGAQLVESPLVTGIEGLEEDGRTRLRITVKTLPEQHWGVQRAFRQRIRSTFAEKGIDLAAPRQQVMVVDRQ